MIRREITVEDGTNLWLLISQVHHAHVSGELTRHWRETFSSDVVAAIAHHDDGWAEWEAEPRFNPESGKPYSFLEMPLVEALAIWDRSIEAARKFGPLGAYIVAGHFYNLLNDSDSADEGPAIAWLTAKRKERTAWIDGWLRADPSHRLEYAKVSQHTLVVADLFSLWLCCDCPLEETQDSILAESPMKLRTEMLLGQFQFAVRECMIGRSERADRWTGLRWTVAVDPYPFRDSMPTLSLKAIAAPARHYTNWQELLTAGWSVELGWRLVPAVPASDSVP